MSNDEIYIEQITPRSVHGFEHSSDSVGVGNSNKSIKHKCHLRSDSNFELTLFPDLQQQNIFSNFPSINRNHNTFSLS